MNIVVNPAAVAPPAPVIDSEALFEIIDGQRVELPPMGTRSIALTNWLSHELDFAARQASYGRAYAEMLFQLPWPGTRNRRPDVAVVSFDRWPKDRVMDDENGWVVVPELIAEIVSPHDLVIELMEKIDEYFRSGVRIVWVVHPRQAQVHIHEPATPIRILSRDGVLDGGSVLPSFRLPLSELFPAAPQA